MVRRNNNIYPVTEIIPVEKLKILPGSGKEGFLVIRRMEEGLLISGLKSYLKGLGKGEASGGDAK